MGKCYIDSINDKFVLNGSNIAFNEFTKYKNGKILTLDGVEIIDSTLLSRLTVTGGKLALDGILVNGLNLSSITSDILPTTTTTLNLGSTGLKFSNVWSSVINTSTLKIDTASITFDGTVLKLGTDTLATREWVNSSAIPVLKTINGQSITGTGDITIVGGSGSGGSTFMDIQYGYMAANITSIAPSTFVAFATNTSNGTLDYRAKVDDSTILIKAGVLYKFEGHIAGITDDDNNLVSDITYGLYSDVAGVNLIKSVDYGYEYLNFGTNFVRAFSTTSYIKSDVDCYLKGKLSTNVSTDSVGITVSIRHTLTKYNTTPIITTGTIELPSYSTTETLTERRWIDGKPIYRKVFTHTIGASTPTDDITIITGLVGNELSWVSDFKVIDSNAMVSTSSTSYYLSDSSENRVYCPKDGSTITIRISDNSSVYSNTTYHITLEYTKTTDTIDSPTALIQGIVSNKKYFARISNGTATSFLRGVTTQIPLSTFGKGDQELHNGTSGFIAPQDDVYTITGQFFSSTSTQANVNEIGLICYVNGVEEGRAYLNPGGTSGSNKGCNLTVNARLNKNDVVTFTLQCWSSDTTTSLSVPVGSLIATIRN